METGGKLITDRKGDGKEQSDQNYSCSKCLYSTIIKLMNKMHMKIVKLFHHVKLFWKIYINFTKKIFQNIMHHI